MVEPYPDKAAFATIPDFPRPPLGIRHLLLVTACAAVYLAVITGVMPFWDRTQGISNTVMAPLSAVGYGTGLAGLIVLALPFFRRERLAPGEKLLVILTKLMFACVSTWFGPSPGFSPATPA